MKTEGLETSTETDQEGKEELGDGVPLHPWSVTEHTHIQN